MKMELGNSSFPKSSIITIAISCVFSTIIGFMIASSSSKMDFTSLLKNLRDKYGGMFGYGRVRPSQNALIVSLLNQQPQHLHGIIPFKESKTFNVNSASTELERRETGVGTTGKMTLHAMPNHPF